MCGLVSSYVGRMGQTHKIWFCSENLVWFVMFDNFCLDLVGFVLSEFFGQIHLDSHKQKEKK